MHYAHISSFVICLSMACFAHAASRSATPKPEASAQEVITQFFGIVAHSLEFAAQNGDKEAQLHALAGIVNNISHIVEIASRSTQSAQMVLNSLEGLHDEKLQPSLKLWLADKGLMSWGQGPRSQMLHVFAFGGQSSKPEDAVECPKMLIEKPRGSTWQEPHDA
ncbi:MAG: hypothetical protein UU47_C0014G0007 [candidate division TM6 bacterium GW2011_GWE2_41_16]|nr:MAG: hypothetical protein UU47_C0014G0007 [candidate division TM6 bacterium GW2011_GWE2_41_16]